MGRRKLSFYSMALYYCLGASYEVRALLTKLHVYADSERQFMPCNIWGKGSETWKKC